MPCTYIFFSCACVVFHIVMEQQWGEGGGGGGQGAVTLAKPQIHPGAVNRGKAVM